MTDDDLDDCPEPWRSEINRLYDQRNELEADNARLRAALKVIARGYIENSWVVARAAALLDLDADGALVPHGIGGLARACLSWGIDEIERIRADNARLRAALRAILDEIIYGGGDMIEEPDIDKLHDIARRALEGRDE